MKKAGNGTAKRIATRKDPDLKLPSSNADCPAQKERCYGRVKALLSRQLWWMLDTAGSRMDDFTPSMTQTVLGSVVFLCNISFFPSTETLQYSKKEIYNIVGQKVQTTLLIVVKTISKGTFSSTKRRGSQRCFEPFFTGAHLENRDRTEQLQQQLLVSSIDSYIQQSQ